MGDGAMAARDDAPVAEHQLPQALLGIADAAHRHEDLVAHLVQAEHHDLEEQRFLALEMMIEPGLCQPEGAGDVADRRGVVAAVAKQLRHRSIHRGTPRIGFARRRQSLSRHLPRYYAQSTDRSVGQAPRPYLPIMNADTKFWTRRARRLKNRTKTADKPQTIAA